MEPQALSNCRFFLADAGIELPGDGCRVLVKDELAVFLTDGVGGEATEGKIAGVLDTQRLHHRTVDAVKGEVLHAPSNAMRFLNPSQSRLITAFLNEPFPGAARLHGKRYFFIILFDFNGLQMSPKTAEHINHAVTEAGLAGGDEGYLRFDGMGKAFGIFDSVNAEFLIYIGLQTGDPGKITIMEEVELLIQTKGQGAGSAYV